MHVNDSDVRSLNPAWNFEKKTYHQQAESRARAYRIPLGTLYLGRLGGVLFTGGGGRVEVRRIGVNDFKLQHRFKLEAKGSGQCGARVIPRDGRSTRFNTWIHNGIDRGRRVYWLQRRRGQGRFQWTQW